MGEPPRSVIVIEADWYDHPLWYDILHTPGTAAEVEGFVHIAKRFLRRPSARRGRPLRWLEPACGSGRYLRALAQRGAQPVGFDANPAMIEFARRSIARRSLRATLFTADLTHFELTPRADLAFCTINTLRHLPTDGAMIRHFEAVDRALHPGAVYIVGLGLHRSGVERESEDVWTGARGRCRVTQLIQYLPPPLRSRKETVINQLLVETPTAEHHLSGSYALRTYTLAQWLALLARTNWRILAACDEAGGVIAGPDAEGLVSDYALWILARRSERGRWGG